MDRSLVIKSTTGFDIPEKTNQAMTVAVAAITAGVETSVWLTGDSVFLAVPGHAGQIALEHAMDMADLVEIVLEGGTLTACTQCVARRGLTQADLFEGVRIAGAPVFVEETLRAGAQALVY
ncbi:DsrE family protein [Populibacterium corticicola]|uniref:DsrE family protein n=1 Tax=Populibacterium corticicola TaxID=1812826 RepID=A0ABW5XDL3_9MICO